VTVEFRPDGEPVLIDSTYSEVPGSRRVGRRLFSNRRHAVEVLSPGKRRDRLLAEYNQQLSPKPKTEVVVVSEPKEAPVAVEVLQPVTTTAVVDTQNDDEAAQEFLNAVSTDDEELYEPHEDEWFAAHIVHTDVRRKYLLLELSTGATVYCPWQKVKRSPGNHSLCLPLGTECVCRMKLDRRKYWGLEMQVEGEEPHGVSCARITKWHGVAGSADRECGCPSIFVLCPRELDSTTFSVGDRVEIVHRPSEKRGWIAIIQRKIGAPTAQEEL